MPLRRTAHVLAEAGALRYPGRYPECDARSQREMQHCAHLPKTALQQMQGCTGSNASAVPLGTSLRSDAICHCSLERGSRAYSGVSSRRRGIGA